MQGKAISIKNVEFTYKSGLSLAKRERHPALLDVSFDLYHGETLGLVGRNGTGKSTLLRLLAGILEPERGQVINYGVSVSLLSLNLGLDPQLNGMDNAVLSALLFGISEDEARANVPKIIEYSELGDAIFEPVKTYSTGMRTRLGFSIAMHLQPDVLLIDETLGVGDITFRQKSTAALKNKINSSQTVVLVSHQTAQLKNLCDRVAWIENGISRRVGETTEVLSEYEACVLKG